MHADSYSSKNPKINDQGLATQKLAQLFSTLVMMRNVFLNSKSAY